MSSSSEDEQDDNVFDQLKSIKAFTVDQLYLLDPDVGCPPNCRTGDSHRVAESTSQNSSSYHDQALYQNMVEYEQLRYSLAQLRTQVRHSHRTTFEHIDKIWIFNEETPRKIGMCQQGKIAETTFRYKQSFINLKQLDALNLSFNELSEMISKDYIYYSFESQMKRYKIVTQLSTSYQNPKLERRLIELRSSIATLIDFMKHLVENKSDFVMQCRKWLRGLMKRFLEEETTENYMFVIAQLCKGPVGTADWSADLIECKPFEQVTQFESTPKYITHCSILLSGLFDNLRSKIKRVTMVSGETIDSDQNWSLLDPRFSCTEDLDMSSNAAASNMLSESDVIKLCLRIPVAQIFRAYVKRCLDSIYESDKNYEYTMLKLLAIGTIIIKTYQRGLETFNSIQYSNLIEYLSSQIRRTVIILSDQWNEFRRRLKGVDNALMMRLQVEYDNFILRSILIILELRQCGIWRHLSQIDQDEKQENECTQSWSADSLRPAFAKLLEVTGLSSTPSTSSCQPNVEQPQIESQRLPAISKSSNSLTYEFSVEWFKEVSEPMLWHILWQFYHSAFVSSCDYHSDNYWSEKFRENSVVYLFVNKIRDSSATECNYLLNSITNMVLSRTRQESKLVNFIATEIFNLSFKYEELKEKITKKGIRSLIKCAEKFPLLISLYMGYMVGEDVDQDVVELFRNCSLSGWLCNDEEIGIIAKWITEYPLASAHNRVARLIITKLLLNSPKSSTDEAQSTLDGSARKTPRKIKRLQCFVDLKLRRRFALLLYESSVLHLPEINDYGPKSLGAFVEVGLGTSFCERSSTCQNNLIDLATDSSYQQFYVWIWRLLFTFKLHILNQPETDWNDVQSRSGTSRSIKNTVLLNDHFHPAPSIQDSECLSLSQGVTNQNPMALFINLLMTDITWQKDSLDLCLSSLNAMADSGHLTPSLMTMKYLTICHLNNLSEIMVKDQRCIEYFTTIITSSYDSTRLASLIMSQMQQLKQYRQLQLSQFYISILLEVVAIIIKRQSSSWFSSDEHNIEKVACLLDYIVKFNFTTQRLEIIRIFYDCSYSLHSFKPISGWFGSIFPSNSMNANSTRREFLTTLHILTQKFKKYTWLRWATTECDARKLEHIWEEIVIFLSTNEESNLESAFKKVCPQYNASILKSMLPIYSWISQIFDIVESDLSHPLCPLIWYNFYLNYFANSLNGVSVGLKLVPQETLTRLLSRLDSLFNYHLYKHRNWTPSSAWQQNSLAQLYRAYRLWLQDGSLQDAYVDIDRLREDYLVPLLKAIMESSTEGVCLQYIDVQTIETQNRNLCQVWLTATQLNGNHLVKDMIFVVGNQDDSIEILTSVDDEASDATSLIMKSHNKPKAGGSKPMEINAEDELRMQSPAPIAGEYRTVEELVHLIKQNFQIVFDESSVFNSNLNEMEKMISEMVELIRSLWSNKKREYLRVIPCADGPECSGPARIKFEVEEATIDDRKSECIQDRQRQCEELIGELLMMPSGRAVQATIVIEDNIKRLVSDSSRAQLAIKTLLGWISEPKTYNQLNGSYHAGNHLLKVVLEILSATDEIDAYNSALIDVCFQHPGSVQIFSPHLTPSSCSTDCFLELYKKISAKHASLGPMATFVLLSKFDVNSWLKSIRDKSMHHDIIRTTCSALKAMGKQPDDSFVCTFDLYTRHIQVELAPPDRRKPEEITLVLEEFLKIMDEQSLAPHLWTKFMANLGLEKQAIQNSTNRLQQTSKQTPFKNVNRNSSLISNTSANNELLFNPVPASMEYDESTIASTTEDIARLADCQTVFDYQALSNLIVMLSKFANARNESTDMTLLELYQDYLDQFSVVMMSVTFMWLKSVSERYPDNHELIWNQFSDLWYHWVFLSKNCQNVGKTSYSLIASQFVASLRYMIFRMPDNTLLVLRSALSNLASYVQRTKEVVYLELTILQRCMKKLPWSSLMGNAQDFENLATLSEQENYNISDLVSHILMQMNIRDSLAQIHDTNPSASPLVAERLATTIVLQSHHLKSFRLNSGFFTLIPVGRIPNIVSLVLPKMEFVNLEHSQSNKLLVNLLRYMCITLNTKPESGISEQFNQIGDDRFDRSIIYAKFVSSYLIDLIKNHPPVLKYHKAYLFAVMDNSLQDLKILLSPDIDLRRKSEIYESLLECCSSPLIDEDSRLLIARSLIKSNVLKDRPIVVLEIFHAIGQIISDGRVLVYTIERMIGIYLNMNGHYEKVCKSFSLKVLPSDLYLEACIEENTPVALLVYFEALARDGQDSREVANGGDDNTSTKSMNSTKIWSSFFHWVSKLTRETQLDSTSGALKSNDTKLSIVWLRLLELFEPNLHHFIQSTSLLASASKNSITDHPEPIKVVDGQSVEQAGGESLGEPDQQQPIVLSLSISSAHKSLIEFLKQLISIYDSYNSSSLWSYLRSTKTEDDSRISLVALSIACFLADRTLICLGRGSQSGDKTDSSESSQTSNQANSARVATPSNLLTMRDEIVKLKKLCLSKLEAARKSKHYLSSTQYIEALIESVNRSDKVQYCDGVQLICMFLKSSSNSLSIVSDEDAICLGKILSSCKEH